MPRLTVIIPTRNEKHSIELLLARLGPAVAPLNAELIFVDDSDDETPDVLAEAGQRHARSRSGSCTGRRVPGRAA